MNVVAPHPSALPVAAMRRAVFRLALAGCLVLLLSALSAVAARASGMDGSPVTAQLRHATPPGCMAACAVSVRIPRDPLARQRVRSSGHPVAATQPPAEQDERPALLRTLFIVPSAANATWRPLPLPGRLYRT